MFKTIWYFLLLVVIAAMVLVGALMTGCSDSDDTSELTITPSPSPTVTDEPSNPVVIMKTNYGDITIELFEDKVPVTVGNFVHLVKDGFYSDVVFHRISDDFMIQAGVLSVDETQKISPYGPINLEIHPEVRHIDGTISMARTNDPNSATGQFFICDGPQPFLDDSYAAFGVVIEGIEVVREIAAQPHDNSNPAGGGVPLSTILIESIKLK